MGVWDKLSSYNKDELRFATVIFGGVRFSAGDCPAHVVQEVLAVIDEWRDDWRRAGNGGSWTGCEWAGQFEIDVVRGNHSGVIGGHREDLLASIGVDVSPLGPDERIAVPHLHVAVGGDVLHAQRRVNHHWQGLRRVVFKRLYQHQTVEEALTKIRGYCAKRIPKYADGGWNGSYGSPVKFCDLWEPWVQDVVDRVYVRLDQSAHHGKHESRK